MVGWRYSYNGIVSPVVAMCFLCSIGCTPKKSANDFGLYDMCGNIAEYCGDWYGAYSSTAKTDPVGPDEGSAIIVRGGDWSMPIARLRSSARLYADISTAHDYGFRMVRNVRD